MLKIKGLSAGYGANPVLKGIDLTISKGSLTAIIGANACGKSTLLRSIAGWLRPVSGRVTLDGDDLAAMSARERARRMAALPQFPLAPDGITVAELVGRGRFAYRRPFRGASSDDRHAVAEALAATGTAELSGRFVAELSGGQRQRVWLAMILAQDSPVILLDEPTSALDLAHQVEVMALLSRLQQTGRTIIAVLHDINQAARHATDLVALADGGIVAQGRPSDIVDAALMRRVMGLDSITIPDPLTGTPMVVPRP